MSVPKSQRTESRLHVHVELRRVVSHTLTKTRNSRKFGSVATYAIERDDEGRVVAISEQRASSREALARHLEDEAIAAASCAWRANDIRVGERGEGWGRRRDLQNRSIEHLDCLLMLVNVAREACGLTGREVRHWSELVTGTRDLVRRWRDADAKRYGRRARGDEGL